MRKFKIRFGYLTFGLTIISNLISIYPPLYGCRWDGSGFFDAIDCHYSFISIPVNFFSFFVAYSFYRLGFYGLSHSDISALFLIPLIVCHSAAVYGAVLTLKHFKASFIKKTNSLDKGASQ